MRPVFSGPIVSLFVFAVSFAANAASEPTTVTKQQEPTLPWRGSAVTYGHAFSALSLSRAADPMYNPNYGHRLELAPQWHFNSQYYLRGRFSLSQEFTLSDDTTYRNEVVASDIALDAATTGWELPWWSLKATGDVRFVLPTSKLSQFQTRRFSIGPAVALTRSFDVRGGLSVRYDARYTYRFHRFTTGELSPSLMPACVDSRDPACFELSQNGVRNISSDFAHGPSVSFKLNDQWSFSGSFGFQHAWLYPLSTVPQSVEGSTQLSTEDDTWMRHNNRFSLEASWQATRELTLSFGTDTFSSQIGLDGRRRFPFFNRSTTFYLDLGVDIEAAFSRL